MQSDLAHQPGCSSTFNSVSCAVMISLATFAMAASPASALTSANSALQYQFEQDSPGGWVRPAHYHWRPGGAIAAGAAIGFVAAATAAAGSPPAPGYCWYYTDPSRTQGFWDVCP